MLSRLVKKIFRGVPASGVCICEGSIGSSHRHICWQPERYFAARLSAQRASAAAICAGSGGRCPGRNSEGGCTHHHRQRTPLLWAACDVNEHLAGAACVREWDSRLPRAAATLLYTCAGCLARCVADMLLWVYFPADNGYADISWHAIRAR